MAIDIVDYLTLPSSDEWVKHNSMIGEKFPDLQFSDIGSSFNLTQMINGEYEVNYWKSEFNSRVFNIGTNYVLMMHFYDKGIPDDQYENLKGDKLAIHMWFSFYAESLIARFIGAYDILFHIVNEKYKIGVKKGLGFNRKVLDQVKGINEELYSLLSKFRRDEPYDKVVGLRNDFIHNNTPTNLDSGLKREKPGVISFGKGNYVKSDDVVDIIIKGLEHLQNIVKKFDELL